MLRHNDDGEIRGHTHCFHRDNFFLILVFLVIKLVILLKNGIFAK